MKNDMGYFYEIEPTMDMNNFVEVFLAALAKNTNIIDFKDSSNKIACLPLNFSESFEKILFAENGWALRFSEFININDYFANQETWEDSFRDVLLEIISNSKKKVEADLATDIIKIPYKKEEIISIYEKHDGKTIEKIEHLARLVMAIKVSHNQSLTIKDKKPVIKEL